MRFQSIVLAAGKGTRMRSEKPKVLHDILGRPMVGYIVEALAEAGTDRLISVVGYGRAAVEEYINGFSEEMIPEATSVVQERQEGTAHAVKQALDQLDQNIEYTLIVPGDVPAIEASWLSDFVADTSDADAQIGLVTTDIADPDGYGRIVRQSSGRVGGIVEHQDATPSQKKISEINAGIYLVRTDLLTDWIQGICSQNPDNAQGEYYLTDIVSLAERVSGWRVDESSTVIGVNTRRALADATSIIQRRINDYWMDRGVAMIDPESTFVGPEVVLQRDVELFPGVQLRGATRIEEGARIENGVYIEDSLVGPGARVKSHSYLSRAEVGEETNIGPSAHLRPGSDIGAGCKIGNFVEVKKAEIKDGAKAGHLAYLGDATIGQGANIGAGTITCNYDGENKHRTEVKPGAFTGSNSALVAPVRLGKNSYVAAGSVITEDVPRRALGIGRARQTNIEDWNGSDES